MAETTPVNPEDTDVPFEQLSDEDLADLESIRSFEAEGGKALDYSDTVVMKAERVHVAGCVRPDDHEGLCEVDPA